MMNTYIHIYAYGYIDERINDAYLHHIRATCASISACSGALASAPNRASTLRRRWTACGSVSQAFSGTSAFNANIGAWNTASVSNMAYVCATLLFFGKHLYRLSYP